MLPPKRSGPVMRHVGLLIHEDTVLRIDEIVEAEKLKSRNQLAASFLSFASNLFPLLKPFQKQIEEFTAKEAERLGREVTYADAVAALVERGLKAKK